MKKSQTLGQFLLSLVYSYGVEHAYGVDGDAVIRIRNEFETFGKIRNITCAHEATAAFSAEIYGRERRLGFFYCTYNAGINNALNAIDEGYLHNSALVIVGGEPSLRFRNANPCLHHHQLRRGEFGDQRKILEVKLGADRVLSITDMEIAAENIATMVGRAVKNRLPVYLGIPSDAWDKEISCDENAIEEIRHEYAHAMTKPDIPPLLSLLRILKQAVNDMERPIISTGHEVKELGLLPETVRFAHALKLPVVARFNGYGAFPVEDELFAGIYNGPASVPPYIRKFAENADRIDIGVLETDLNFALQTETVKLPPAAIVFDPREECVSVGTVFFSHCGVDAQKWLLARLSEELEPRQTHKFKPFSVWLEERGANWRFLQKKKTGNEPIEVADIGPIINDFLKDNDMPIIADVGDAMFIALEILPSIPSRATYTSIFAAMGVFAGCIGLEHATGKKPLVLVGDGAFCMGESYSLMLAGAKPIIIILNNGGWSMIRQIRAIRNDVSKTEKDNRSLVWPQTMDFRADHIVNTSQELKTALRKALLACAPYIIDVRLHLDDKSEPLKNFVDMKK